MYSNLGNQQFLTYFKVTCVFCMQTFHLYLNFELRALKIKYALLVSKANFQNPNYLF